MICSSLYLLVLMSIILQVDGLLGKMTGTVYGGQVRFMPANFQQYTVNNYILNDTFCDRIIFCLRHKTIEDAYFFQFVGLKMASDIGLVNVVAIDDLRQVVIQTLKKIEKLTRMHGMRPLR